MMKEVDLTKYEKNKNLYQTYGVISSEVVNTAKGRISAGYVYKSIY